jgi:hypothetical protein
MTHVFLDESGVNKPYGISTVVLLYVNSERLELLNNSVVEAKENIGINTFHWAHTAWEYRYLFTEAISKLEFTAKVAIIRNPFHAKRAYEHVIKYLATEKNISSIVLDGKKNRSNERSLKKALRDKGVSLKTLKTGNDESIQMLQIADLCAGIIRAHHERPEDSRVGDLYKKIKNKIITIIFV